MLNTNSFTKIYLATDHAGFELKEKVRMYLKEGFKKNAIDCEIVDYGAFKYDGKDDYTDFIHQAGESLSIDIGDDISSRAIVFGGSGEGEGMVMNRYAGVRCTVYYGYNLDLVKLGREHNNANAISFSGRFVEEEECIRAVEMFLDTKFDYDSRHHKRNIAIDRPEDMSDIIG